MGQGERGSHFGQIIVFLTPESNRARDAKTIIEDIRPRIKVDEQLKVFFERTNPGPPTGKPINIGVQGEKYEGHHAFS